MSDAAPAPGGQGAAPAAAPSAPPAAPSTAAALAATPPAPAAPTSQQVTTPPAAPPAAPKWLDGADPDTLGYVQNKGWDDPVKAVQSYRNLEKLLGADKAGNAIVLPKADADPKEWGAVYDRLGRPADAKGYEFKAPEFLPKEVVEATLAKYHELGLSKSQGEKLAQFEAERAVTAQQQIEQQRTTQFQAQDSELKTEWGAAYNQNLTQAQAAMRALGLDAKLIDGISDAIGHKATMKLLQTIGSKTGEAGFVPGNGAPGFSGAMSPEQATVAIKAKMADKEWSTRYLNGGAVERAEMERLHKFKAGMQA